MKKLNGSMHALGKEKMEEVFDNQIER